MRIEKRIEKRQIIRADINLIMRDKKYLIYPGKMPEICLLISESLDDYIEQRIETDKVLEGILKELRKI